MTVPNFLAALFEKGEHLAKAAGSGIKSRSRPPRISIGTNRFSLIDADGHAEMIKGDEINVVVVGANPYATRLFWGLGPDGQPKDYEGAATQRPPPICLSHNGVGPSVFSSEPQNPTCQGCKHARWGAATSKQSGKGIPACQERKTLAVLYGRTDPVTQKVEHRLYEFIVPPKSLSNWKDYSDYVDKHKSDRIAMNQLVTTIKFHEKQVGVLEFGTATFVDETTAPAVFRAMDTDLAYFTHIDDEPVKLLAPPTSEIAGVAPGIYKPDAAAARRIAEGEEIAEEWEEGEETSRDEEGAAEEEAPPARPIEEAPPVAAAPTRKGRPPGAKNKPKSNGGPVFGMKEPTIANGGDDAVLAKAMSVFNRGVR